MPTKDQLSEEVNNMLGTEMEWDRLLEEDLRQFHEMLESGSLADPVIKQFVKKHGKEQLEKQVDEWYPGKFALELI